MTTPTQDSLSDANNRADEDMLVIQAKAGEVAAFEKLYRKYYNRICSYLVHTVGDEGVGCELTQETFFKAWQALPSLRKTATFTGWLYRIATNLAYDYQRYNKRRIKELYDRRNELEEMIVVGPEEQIEAEETLRLALASIPWKYRACLILYHVEGISKQKIAAYLEIKENSVGTYVSAGMEQLRQNYGKISTTHYSKRGEEV
jgi:RNA polymerase sigma-70 factor, ECF subfamily